MNVFLCYHIALTVNSNFSHAHIHIHVTLWAWCLRKQRELFQLEFFTEQSAVLSKSQFGPINYVGRPRDTSFWHLKVILFALELVACILSNIFKLSSAWAFQNAQFTGSNVVLVRGIEFVSSISQLVYWAIINSTVCGWVLYALAYTYAANLTIITHMTGISSLNWYEGKWTVTW